MALACFQLREDARDCLRLGDFANHAQLPPAVGTHTQVDTENPIEPGHPSHRRTRGLGGVVVLRSARAGGLPGHGEVTVSGLGREKAMISDEIGTRSRHQSGEPSDEVVGFEQHVGGAI